MKKSLYILFFSIFSLVFFTNNASGPVNAQQAGFTGAPGDDGTCNNCHSGGSYNPTATLEVFDSAGTKQVTQYALGKQYTIRLTITSASGTPSGYGFQMIDIRKSDNTNVKGFLTKALQANNIGIDTISSSKRVYAEQNGRISNNVINVKWKAPATNIGAIVFYGVGNAVNGNQSESGDKGTASVSVEITAAATAATNELAENIRIQLSPNPTPSVVTIELDSKVSRALALRVTDISGRAVISEKWAIQAGDNQKTVDLNNLLKGAYMIQILDNQNVVSKKIIKL